MSIQIRSKHFVTVEAVTTLQLKPPVTKSPAEERALPLDIWHLYSHLGVGSEVKHKARLKRLSPSSRSHSAGSRAGNPRTTGAPQVMPLWHSTGSLYPFPPTHGSPNRCHQFSIKHPQRVTYETPGQSRIKNGVVRAVGGSTSKIREGYGCQNQSLVLVKDKTEQT